MSTKEEPVTVTSPSESAVTPDAPPVIAEKTEIIPEKKKRVLSDKQREALAKGQAILKQRREERKSKANSKLGLVPISDAPVSDVVKAKKQNVHRIKLQDMRESVKDISRQQARQSVTSFA